MKKYHKRTLIITGTIVVSSIIMGNAALAAAAIGTGLGGPGAALSLSSSSTARPAIIGMVATVKDGGFTLGRSSFMGKRSTSKTKNGKPGTGSPGSPAGGAAPSPLTVKTTGATVYLRNGKLDESVTVTEGEMIAVTGTVDLMTGTVTATGVNVIE